MKIGVRNLKTAIAVFISIILSNGFGFPSPFLAAITAFMLMETSVVNSYRSGKDRILGTLLGAVLGFLMCLIMPGNVYLCAIGIILIISISIKFNWSSSVVTSSIIFISIMFGVVPGADPLKYSLISILGTFLGIVVALAVNFFIAPPNHTIKIYRSCQYLRDRTSDLIRQRLCFKETVDTSGFYTLIQTLQEELATHLHEIRLSKDRPIDVDNINQFIFVHKHIYFHLKVLNELDQKYCLTQNNIDKIKNIYGIDPKTNICVNGDDSIVFNYHAERILDEFISLQGLTITQSDL
ncbi:MAG: aromatic acid exporter family protein [Clostridium sp.]